VHRVDLPRVPATAAQVPAAVAAVPAPRRSTPAHRQRATPALQREPLAQQAAPAIDTGGAPPPAGEAAPATYRTRIPPPFLLAFELQRGAAIGRGELRFDPGPDGYALTLTTQIPGREALGLASRGRLDAHGLAPERYADLRRGRERQAANFDRDSARITYSGPPVAHELLPGAQDRLSWMVQLPAIVEADPAAFGAGAKVRVQVSGARGDAAVWTFVVQGHEAGGGASPGLLHLVREPARPYDTRVEAWLDPGRGHLPARLRLSYPPAGEGLELRAAAVIATPTP